MMFDINCHNSEPHGRLKKKIEPQHTRLPQKKKHSVVRDSFLGLAVGVNIHHSLHRQKICKSR